MTNPVNSSSSIQNSSIGASQSLPSPQETGFIDSLYMLLNGSLGPVSADNPAFMSSFSQLIINPAFLNALKTSSYPGNQDLYDTLNASSTPAGGKSLIQAAQDYANGNPTALTIMIKDPNRFSFFQDVSQTILNNYSGVYNYQFPGSAADKTALQQALTALSTSQAFKQLLTDFNSGNTAAAQADAKALGTNINNLYQLVSKYPNDGFCILVKNILQTVFGQGTSIESIAQEFSAGNYTHLADFCYFLISGLQGSAGIAGSQLVNNLSYYILKYGSLN